MPPPTATYDPALPTDKDWVRWLVGDTNVAAALLDDRELDALLAGERSNGKTGGESSQVYLAAARALDMLGTRLQVSGQGGILETQIGGLRIKRGDGQSIAASITKQANDYRRRGAFLLSPAPRVLRAL